MAKHVELKTAFAWECPGCSAENFDRAVSAEGELEHEVAEELKRELGYEPWEEGELVKMPETVTCRGCLEVFSTKPRRPR